MHSMAFCFVCILATADFSVPASSLRAALDWKHDEAARCQRQIQRRGGTASKGTERAGFSPDTPRPLRCRRDNKKKGHAEHDLVL